MSTTFFNEDNKPGFLTDTQGLHRTPFLNWRNPQLVLLAVGSLLSIIGKCGFNNKS